MKLTELVAYLDRTLCLADFSGDHSNNGLQVEGKPEVRRAAFAVDAALATFARAAELKADFLFVHHGLSWGSEPRRFTGMTARRLALLFRHEISLYGVHLPLDAHPELGNNAGLAELLGLRNRQPYFEYDGVRIGIVGELPQPQTDRELAARLERALAAPAEFGGPPRSQRCLRLAICSGGGGLGALEAAAAAGADTLITGEFDQVMFHPALELGIRVLALGHYATETVGPHAVMAHLARTFELECTFIELPTGR